ncbi:MAG TPA: tRNA (guanosine(46)-N7)-methyltransferase TrmB [Gammaproteobacteria bacterium]|nr:tRNA (guanosine(46)-N7)-methyltransferase TrmB [Gammaproteobacteria bacterium]
MSAPANPLHRRIRSFVLREGRLTKGQQQALDGLFPRFGVSLSQGPLDFASLFGRPPGSQGLTILEIGFGNGISLAEMAAKHPQNDYFGIEVHRPGVGNLLLQMEAQGLKNIRVSHDDAIEVLQQQIPDQALDAVYLFFPDPWHKRKHHKRRIVQPEFVQLIHGKLKIGGIFHMATDWQHYAQHMMKVMNLAAGFENNAGTDQYTHRPDYRPLTKFEQRGHRLGHGVWDIIFRRI